MSRVEDLALQIFKKLEGKEGVQDDPVRNIVAAEILLEQSGGGQVDFYKAIDVLRGLGTHVLSAWWGLSPRSEQRINADMPHDEMVGH